MTKKTCTFITVMMVMLLVLGLTLAACGQKPAETVTPPAATPPAATPPAATPPAAAPPAATPPAATPPAASAPSFKANTYTNSEYGFSIQYPSDWSPYPAVVKGSVVASFSVPGFVPGVSLSVRDAAAPLTAAWIVAANTDEGNTEVVVTSDVTPTTLNDGTPAFQYTSKFTSGGYEVVSYATSYDKNGKRIRATVWTIDAFSPYDATLFSEIGHTLTAK